MGTTLGPKYIPYTYMDPLGHINLESVPISPHRHPIVRAQTLLEFFPRPR